MQDGSGKYKTVPESTRRFRKVQDVQKVQDGSGKYKTVQESKRRFRKVQDGPGKY